VVLLKRIIWKNTYETSVIFHPSQQDHVKKKKKNIQNTGEISSNGFQKLQDDTTMKAEMLKDTIFNNTTKESNPIPAEKQMASQMLIFLFYFIICSFKFKTTLYSSKYSQHLSASVLGHLNPAHVQCTGLF
jgi:hypothetical protein